MAECLGYIKSTHAKNHIKESIRCKAGLQDIHNNTFNLSNGQDVDSLNHTIIMGGEHPDGKDSASPQLPVIVLRHDCLAFSLTTADLRIWKESDRFYHRASANLSDTPLLSNRHYYFAALTMKSPSDFAVKRKTLCPYLIMERGVLFLPQQQGFQRKTSLTSETTSVF